MTSSPKSTRPATRRELRERAHADAAHAPQRPLPVFGDALRPSAPDLIDEVPRFAADTETAAQAPDPQLSTRYRETVTVDAVEPDAEPDFLSVLADEEAAAAKEAANDAVDAANRADVDDSDATSGLAALFDADTPTRETHVLPGAPVIRAAPLVPTAAAPEAGTPGSVISGAVAAEAPAAEAAPARAAGRMPEPDSLPARPAPTTGPLLLDELRALEEQGTAEAAATPLTAWADESRPPTALTWLDESQLRPESMPEPRTAPDLFADARLMPGWLRPRVLIPIGIVAALCGSYVATTLLWPLDSVAPTAETANVEIAPAAAATVTWPAEGSAAVGIAGIAPVASTTQRDEIASISKVASVLMVLDELPLQPGEQGPSFEFDSSDARDYWSYRRSDQSALDVPVGGSLTEYQMLQGVLLGSANNYIDRLSDELWGSDRAFSRASEKWLRDHGLRDITLESPSGFDKDNTASPEALLRLGELAMKNPVFAEIVATRTAEIPGAGTITNTNGMLADPGVVGIKTGTLTHWNLLTAKDVQVGDSTVRVYAAVLGQEDDEARLEATRQLFSEVETSLAEQPIAVPKGTVVGHVSTEWGDRVDVVTDADAQVVLWNGATATATTELDLGDKTEAGATVGTLTAQGPLGAAETSVSLAGEITAPSIWWRLTHPLELLGIDNS